MDMVSKVSLAVLSLLSSICKVSAILPSPCNLTVQTLNTQYILRWQWEPLTPANQSITFTSQYLHIYKIRRKKQDWTTVCNTTLQTQCDFTGSQLHYQGCFVLRVRAECAGESSEWVQEKFCPVHNATLGPPSKVEVIPGNGFLRLRISDPLTSDNKSMRETLLPGLYFYIQYWKQSQNMEGSQVLNTSNSDATLVNLQSWTTYCVKVRCHFDALVYSKIGLFSSVVCKETEGQIPVWLVILAAFPVLAVLSFGLYRFTPLFKSIFFPSVQLPASMYPCDGSELDWSRLLAREAQLEEFCEKLEVLPKVVPPETPPLPALLEPPWHRHQDGDSGMYSTEQGSGQQGGASEQTSGALGSLGGAPRLLGGTSGPLGSASWSLGGALGSLGKELEQMASGHTGVATALVNPAESGQDSGIGRMVAV